MAHERTLSIIKPDGVKKNVIGKIVAMFEAADLAIVEVNHRPSRLRRDRHLPPDAAGK